MPAQHKYTSAVQVTENVARVDSVNYLPQRGVVQVIYLIGAETGGVFTKTDVKKVEVEYDTLSGALQSTFDNLEALALTYGENQGLYPGGSQEPQP